MTRFTSFKVLSLPLDTGFFNNQYRHTLRWKIIAVILHLTAHDLQIIRLGCFVRIENI